MATKLRQSLKSVLLAGAGMALVVPSAYAQLSGANDDEIIVTATKRAESIQDVPLSIEAVTGTTLEDLRHR